MESIRICTWNINLGLKLEKILDQIQSREFKQLDFFLLQEASIQHGQEDAQTIAQKFGKHYLHLQTISQQIRKRPQSNAIIWNPAHFTLKTALSMRLPKYRSTPLSRSENALLNFVKKQTRTALMIEGILLKLQLKLRLYSIHLDVLGWQHKTAQLAHVLDIGSTFASTDLTIIAGDFNTLSFRNCPTYQSLKSLLASHNYQDITSTITHSYQQKRFRPKQKLDFIFVKPSPKLKYSSNAWTIPTSASDHLPIFAQINIRMSLCQP